MNKKRVNLWQSQSRTGIVCLFILVAGALRGGAQVGPPPVILVQPLDQTAIAGTAAEFSVVVASASNPSFKWRHNGNVIPGANQSTYLITGVQSNHAGIYDVQVRNNGGTVTSSNATLTVVSLPILINSARITSNAFQIQLSGPVGATYVIEASADLTSWTPIFTNSAPTGSATFTDLTITNRVCRYYRATFQ